MIRTLLILPVIFVLFSCNPHLCGSHKEYPGHGDLIEFQFSLGDCFNPESPNNNCLKITNHSQNDYWIHTYSICFCFGINDSAGNPVTQLRKIERNKSAEYPEYILVKKMSEETICLENITSKDYDFHKNTQYTFYGKYVNEYADKNDPQTKTLKGKTGYFFKTIRTCGSPN